MEILAILLAVPLLGGVAAGTDQRQDHGAEQGDPENEK